MENKQAESKIVNEPKAGDRFGLGGDMSRTPSKATKFGVAATVISIAGILMVRSPQDQVDVRPLALPEIQTSDLKAAIKLETYSEKEDSQKQTRSVAQRASMVKLPGLQKIDRQFGGKIPPGSVVQATLASGASNGPVKAVVKEALRIGGETLVPEGATLFGVGQSTEGRLFVRFTNLILKDGSFSAIQAQAADRDDQTVGLKGSRIGSYAMKYGAAIGLHFVGGLAEGLQEREVVNQQVVKKTDAKNALLNGASRATIEMAQETMNGIRNDKPIIQIESGREILVMFDGSN